jgi:hypothetical protein
LKRDNAVAVALRGGTMNQRARFVSDIGPAVAIQGKHGSLFMIGPNWITTTRVSVEEEGSEMMAGVFRNDKYGCSLVFACAWTVPFELFSHTKQEIALSMLMSKLNFMVGDLPVVLAGVFSCKGCALQAMLEDIASEVVPEQLKHMHPIFGQRLNIVHSPMARCVSSTSKMRGEKRQILTASFSLPFVSERVPQ